MQKKLLVLAVIAALMAAIVAVPADAAKNKKKKKKKPKLVATTLFMEGESAFGEVDAQGNGDYPDGDYLKLQGAEGGGEKSMQILNYGAGPNPRCAGNSLFPVFVGPLVGTVAGDITVKFTAMSTPGGSVDVQVWPNVGAIACDEDYIEPARSAIVALPAGQGTVEAVLEGVDFPAASQLMIQITPVVEAPFIGRMFYGTADSTVEFSCIPASGSSCIPS